MAERCILIVDDDETMVSTLARVVSQDGHRAVTALSGHEGLRKVADCAPDLVITDLVMPGMDGISFVRSLKAIDPALPVIMITGHGSIDSAVEAMREGAFHYLTKPISMRDLLLYVSKALESREALAENRYLREQLEKRYRHETIIGRSRAMREVMDHVEQVAPSTATVLITGDTGTGKEVVAEAIHFLSPRTGRPLVKVNCGALPDTLVESELFGHVRGAFTGAHRDRQGRFEAADTGTIFLDEIGAMTPAAQVRLLRVLQEGEFERVGGTSSIKVNVRVVAATNQPLEKAVEERTFREDLYYRIKVFHIHLPTLQERHEDITLLAHHFMNKYAERNKKRLVGFGEKSMQILESHSWPGNVRELENAIEYAVVVARGDRITALDLPRDLRPSREPDDRIVLPVGISAAEAEGILIRRTLDLTRGDKDSTAAMLGFSLRTLYRKIKEHGIPLDRGDKSYIAPPLPDNPQPPDVL
ncbi:MAG TPA: sigma-54 dependent transcriptional regulator [bacterium]|nr:sigma-54 dependent transcriptional regulator [bacterium]HQP99563.1 sigma-54 dependent transcriptional regulator [bacterium]